MPGVGFSPIECTVLYCIDQHLMKMQQQAGEVRGGGRGDSSRWWEEEEYLDYEPGGHSWARGTEGSVHIEPHLMAI